MQEHEARAATRKEARAFEDALPPSQRKELGQFFSGMQLGRVLAHLSMDCATERIIDPMAGNGNLLDAAAEAFASAGIFLGRVDGIEIDGPTAAACDQRLRNLHDGDESDIHVVCGDAFDLGTYEDLSKTGYDLVITNPPYVRYQSLTGRVDLVRQGLSKITEKRLSGCAREIWRALADGYSGLADLSVPAWLLSALLVKPQGRLGLVVPATWRSRAYADVIRYLLLRCFRLEIIVEDAQQCWFSNALVRTHLIIARRLSDNEMAVPLNSRILWPKARWIQVAPEASSPSSLVGHAFAGAHPEAAFAEWCFERNSAKAKGITPSSFPLEEEWHMLRVHAAERPWMRKLEDTCSELPIFAQAEAVKAFVPDALREFLPTSFAKQALRTLADVGICTGQGLRTGCNQFFYVRFVGETVESLFRVLCDPALGERLLSVPCDAIKPVLHRQADLEAWRTGTHLATRVLDLRRLVLPEDRDRMLSATEKHGSELPAVMSDELADYVRKAGRTVLGTGPNSKPISGLSAVKTNIRSSRAGKLPRFWYMLSDFTPRHLPQAFVPRIIHDSPRVYGNIDPPILIDSNFSTFWTDDKSWTAVGLRALLNSTWCRAVMEATGTPLGGGALKLEVVHLRRMPVPDLDPQTIMRLNATGQETHQADRVVFSNLLSGNPSDSEITTLAQCLNKRRASLAAARQRGPT